jgi:hypothetical protein
MEGCGVSDIAGCLYLRLLLIFSHFSGRRYYLLLLLIFSHFDGWWDLLLLLCVSFRFN